MTSTATTIPWWRPEVGVEERDALLEVADSNYLNEGDVTTEFERRCAALLGARYAVTTTSGTAAIFLALKGLNVGHGDEVIVPDVTFIATANAVTLTGATPILVDVDPETLMLDPLAVECAFTPRTKAVVPVHVSGRAAAIERLLEIANRRGVPVVEDAAEALFSRHDGRCLGTFGTAGCFSFSPNKTVTTGQGGLVVTADDALAVRLRELKDQGRPVRGTGGNDIHAVVGFNFKLTNMQAAVGLCQLRRLEERAARLQNIYRWYADGLAGVPQIRLLAFDVDRGESPQWVDALAGNRDELVAHLLRNGMHCRPFWFPIHTQRPYLRPDDQFPVSSRLMPDAVWLPSAFQLAERDVRLVCDEIRRFYAQAQGPQRQGLTMRRP
jgi:perosamine synthetase